MEEISQKLTMAWHKKRYDKLCETVLEPIEKENQGQLANQVHSENGH